MAPWPQRFAASGYLTVLLLPAVLLIGVAIAQPLLAFGTVILVFPLARVVLGTYGRPAVWREGLATALHALPLIFALVFAGVLAGLMVLLAKRPLTSPGDGLSLVLSMGITFEPPRFLRRLQSLTGWSHEEDKQVLTRGSRACSANGFRSPRRVPIAVGGHRIHCAQDRLRGTHPAGMGQAY